MPQQSDGRLISSINNKQLVSFASVILSFFLILCQEMTMQTMQEELASKQSLCSQGIVAWKSFQVSSGILSTSMSPSIAFVLCLDGAICSGLSRLIFLVPFAMKHFSPSKGRTSINRAGFIWMLSSPKKVGFVSLDPPLCLYSCIGACVFYIYICIYIYISLYINMYIYMSKPSKTRGGLRLCIGWTLVFQKVQKTEVSDGAFPNSDTPC